MCFFLESVYVYILAFVATKASCVKSVLIFLSSGVTTSDSIFFGTPTCGANIYNIICKINNPESYAKFNIFLNK